MAATPGHHHDEKAAATISSSSDSSATIHSEFLLHLLRKSNKINNQTKEEVFNDNIKTTKPIAATSSVEEAWQLTDPAVAVLGPSHTFQNPKPKPNPNANPSLQNPNVWLHSLHDANKDQPLPLPLAFDQSPRGPYLNPYPFRTPSPFGAGAGAAAAHGHGHGHLGIPPPPPWMRGGMEGRSFPYGHTGGSERADVHCEDAWQLQKHGADLRGPSQSSRGGLGFPLGAFRELRAKAVSNCTFSQNCVQGNSIAYRLDENRNCIARNDVSVSHTTPVPGEAWLPVAQEQFIRDENLQFGSIAWHSEHGKYNTMNGIHLHHKNKFELNSGDIFLDNNDLPLNLQGENGTVRFLCRPSSNQQDCVNRTDEEVTWQDSKAQVVVEPRDSKGSVTSFEQEIIKGKAEVVQGRRDTVHKKTTGFAMNNTFYRDHRKKESEVQTSLEIERDSDLNSVHHNGCGQSDLIRNDSIRIGAARSGITKVRHIMEPAKELTQIRTDGEGMENDPLQSGDGDAFKKYRASQQEWRIKQSQIDGLMQSVNLDSFSTITGSSSVQALENEQYHKESVEVTISEENQKFAVGRRRQGKQRADLTRSISEEAHIEDTAAVYRANPAHLRPIGDRDRYHNRNNLALSRVYKVLDSNTSQGMLMHKQYRRQGLMKIRQKEFQYRVDLEVLNPGFLSLFKSLIPQDEEETNRKQLISSLEKLINRQWPGARLHLFGSCANAFGVSKSDIDVCLSIDFEPSSKAELVLKLAAILQAEDMQNVQALTHARVPIVKFTDPATDISCDICINNILAIVNTKLLRDYAQIDVRLRQLAFMVKHWAKCRRINETYQGTLSSYAYVLLCIHFLQQRKPAILPCLQEMEATYQVTIGEIVCAYYDKVNELKHYGAGNKESLSQLLSTFFDYWAFRHDYANSVISVRTGRLLSKNEKDWTRRIGNERHLICIEDPFEISHDLGRVVDKHSIRVLKEEFQRAAEIMLYDPDPCITLFKPYMPS